MHKNNFQKSTIESGRQAIENSSIWGQIFFSQIDWNVVKKYLKRLETFLTDSESVYIMTN